MFCYFVNRHSFHFVKLLEFLGFNSFWVNAFLWLLVKLALFELKLKYGSLENFLEQADHQRNSPNEKAV